MDDAEREVVLNAIQAPKGHVGYTLQAAAAALVARDAFEAACLSGISKATAEVVRDKRGGSKPGRPSKIPRLLSQWPQQYLGADPTYKGVEFRERFGVPRCVFEEIVNSIGGVVDGGVNCAGTRGMDGTLAIMYTLRRCRTGCPADQFDDQVGFAGSTLTGKFNLVIDAALEALGPTYLPTNDVVRHSDETAYNAGIGWPGCFGSYDAMHVKWRAPKRVQALCKGRHDSSNMLVAAVSHHDLYCASLHITPGSLNDLNARDTDPLLAAITYCE